MESRANICLECGRGFSTVTGLALHRKRAHPDQFNLQISIERTRPRWSMEELGLLAEAEASLRRAGVAGVIRELRLLFPSRTEDGIKGARRKEVYRQLLAGLMGEVTDEPSMVELPLVRSPISIVERAVAVDSARGDILRSCLAYMTRDHQRWNYRMVCDMVNSSLGGGEYDDTFRLWLEVTFPPDLPTLAPSDFGVPDADVLVEAPRVYRMGARMSRRTEYASLQNLWRKDRSAAAVRVLGSASRRSEVRLDCLYDYWCRVFDVDSAAWNGMVCTPEVIEDFSGLLADFTDEELRSSSIGLTSAAGPDGVTPMMWSMVPNLVKRTLFNLFLHKASLPGVLCVARVTLIPKCEGPSDPSHFRPIAVASVILRQFHKILAARLARSLRFHDAQRGFLVGRDGVAESVTILDSLLTDANRKRRELHIAVLDVAKAFDSVSHFGLFSILRARGLPEEFLEHLESLYSRSTVVFGSGRLKRTGRVGRGVRQGDPLSPLLFNACMDHVLNGLPSTIGYWLGTRRVKALAYADDLILVSSSRAGMGILLSSVRESLMQLGLELNSAKCFTVSLVPSGRQKLLRVVDDHPFLLADMPLRTLPIGGFFEYLGVPFTTAGCGTMDVPLDEGLQRISGAPLKPVQRVTLLKDFLLPKYFHGLVLGKVDIKYLKGMDVKVRRCLRRWLHLPHDSPNAFFHAAVKDGGLGVPSMAYHILEWKRRRIKRALDMLGLGAGEESDGVVARGEVRRVMARRLYSMVDGMDLCDSSLVPASTAWIASSAEISSREYIQFLKLWTGSLPTRVRMARGRQREYRLVRCRRCLRADETAAHIVQLCAATHGGRVYRHNAGVAILRGALVRAGWTVYEEPILSVGTGVLKPDLVVVRSRDIVVLDLQVVSGRVDLEEINERKIRKYATSGVRTAVLRLLDRREGVVRVLGATLTWKGIWCQSSWRSVRRLGVPDIVFAWMSERTIRGSHMNFSRFCSALL